MSTPTNSPTSRRKSQRKRASASEAEEEPTMKKNKTDQSASRTIWNDEQELALLKGFVGYRVETGLQPNSDWEAFNRFLGDSDCIAGKYSKEQIRHKIGSLKRKFTTRMEKIDRGEEEPISSEAFRYSKMIWGQNDSHIADERVNLNQEGRVEEEDEQVAANVQLQPLNVDLVNQEEEHIEDEQVAAAAAAANVQPENAGARTEVDTDAADESRTLRDAFEKLVPQALSESKKKWQLRNLTNLGAGKRRELSQEWEAISAEEVQMEMKKLRFLARLLEAATANNEIT